MMAGVLSSLPMNQTAAHDLTVSKETTTKIVASILIHFIVLIVVWAFGDGSNESADEFLK